MAKKRSLLGIYKALSPYVSEIGQATLVKPDFFDVVLKAAFVKTFDFNQYVSNKKHDSHSFYLTATLRGICEDLIVLKSFLGVPKTDRSKLVTHIQMSSCYEGMKSQEEFFEQNRPWEPVLSYKNIETLIRQEKDELLKIYQQTGFVTGKQKSLKIKELAARADILSLYDFIYSATSRWVHFNPHILMRMGWTKDEDLVNGNYIFSVNHFSGYYAAFNRHYGTYLFAIFYETFKDELKINTDTAKLVDQLKEILDNCLTWPGVVTFEEMNLKRPSVATYLFARMKHDNPDIDDKTLASWIDETLKSEEK